MQYVLFCGNDESHATLLAFIQCTVKSLSAWTLTMKEDDRHFHFLNHSKLCQSKIA